MASRIAVAVFLLALAAAPAAHAGTCTGRVGWDWGAGGAEYKTVSNVADASACCALCSAEPLSRCVGWVYDQRLASNKKCYLKDATPDNYNAGFKPLADITSGVLGCTGRAGWDWGAGGSEYATKSDVISAAACCDFCTADSRCAGWVYDMRPESNKRCYLKDATGPNLAAGFTQPPSADKLVAGLTRACAPGRPSLCTTCKQNADLAVTNLCDSVQTQLQADCLSPAAYPDITNRGFCTSVQDTGKVQCLNKAEDAVESLCMSGQSQLNYDCIACKGISQDVRSFVAPGATKAICNRIQTDLQLGCLKECGITDAVKKTSCATVQTSDAVRNLISTKSCTALSCS